MWKEWPSGCPPGGLLLKNFGRFAASCTQRLKQGVEKLAEAAGLEVQVHEVHSIVCLISQM